MRSGRLDRKIEFPHPSEEVRALILQMNKMEHYMIAATRYDRKTTECLYVSSCPEATWESIYSKVALDAANALAYLHNQEAKQVHHDFKSSSILLDFDYNAKLCTLWLAKDGPVDGNSHASTRVVGTNGYAAPECIDTGDSNVTSDIYTFGVVLLEILTGWRCIDKKLPPDEQMLEKHSNILRSRCWCQGVQQGSSLLDVIQEQENVLQECVNQLETVEKTRSSLISQLKEALQDQSYWARASSALANS
ncbi:Protein kinase, ATP binding site-containing protein [Artemisia annua]|uniref:Protein kinase, ATP binding site-containing protein n=1 Tax=Artemisia annua TaxID=35608 RepID=A0A2U1N2G3_ARTAN|nr:Protein kinase, ATP binding site-containing protein [Artemisia annua]